VTSGQVDGDTPPLATRVSGASIDFTDQKLAEERLRESESRFRTVADSAPVLIWMSGVDKRCTFLNNPWLEFTGRTAEQEMGDGWTEGVHPDDRLGFLKGYVEAFDARQPFTVQYRLRRHDGEYRWISDTGVPRFDSQGTFAGYIGSCLDITERMRAEERVRQVFEAAPNAMIMVSDDGTIALVNAQVENVFGYQPWELLDRPVEMLIPERLRHEHPMHRKRFVGDPQARAMGAGRLLFGRRKDGSEVPVEISLNPIRTTDGLFVVASVIDITERQKAEAEAQELRQELAHIARVATMGELTAAIVHELAQPLAAIRITAQAGLRLIAAGKYDAEQAPEILRRIVADDERARRVIENLRSMFQKGKVERRPLILNQVLNDVVSVVQRDAERRRVALVLDLAAPALWVSGDRVQLQQVVLNLIVNAFDALDEVSDRPRTVTLRTHGVDGQQAQVDVEDSGPGIGAERLGSIFNPFVTSKTGGMGMGLSVSRSIVIAHDGRLWAENGPTGGAIFHVALPVIAAPEVR
jgi:PAS domain S-box-containing protein